MLKLKWLCTPGRKTVAIRLTRILLFSLAALMLTSPANAKGKGPIAVWPVTDRYSLVADKSVPGMVLVDLESGRAVERLDIQDAKPKGVASCPSCDFALITGQRGDFRLLRFNKSVADLIRENGRLGLADAEVEKVLLATENGELKDGRMVVITQDGKYAYIASSDDRAVFRVELDGSYRTIEVTKHKKEEPYGINWDRDGNLLVSMHKRYVWRIRENGEVMSVYDVRDANCPGASPGEFYPNLRAAIDDPVVGNSILILANKPNSYDAVIWRLTAPPDGTPYCTNVAGMIGRDPGWVDASGEEIEFSRPHHFALRPDSDPPQLIITDIDNRSLRLLNLETMASTSVMYNRDRRVASLPPGRRASRLNCQDLDWDDARATTGPLGYPSCLRPVKPEALSLSLADSRAHCESEGARLCEPDEVRNAGLPAGSRAWTNAECASCWMRGVGGKCDADISTYKSPGLLHRHEGFKQSWDSGQAMVVIGDANQGTESSTMCQVLDGDPKAAAPCCADQAITTETGDP